MFGAEIQEGAQAARPGDVEQEDEVGKRRWTKSRGSEGGLARRMPTRHVFNQPNRSVDTPSTRTCASLTCILVVFAASLLASLSVGHALGASRSVGYALGAWSTGTKNKGTNEAPPPKPKAAADSQEDSDSEEEDVADGDLSAVKPGLLEPCKLVRGFP